MYTYVPSLISSEHPNHSTMPQKSPQRQLGAAKCYLSPVEEEEGDGAGGQVTVGQGLLQ